MRTPEQPLSPSHSSPFDPLFQSVKDDKLTGSPLLKPRFISFLRDFLQAEFPEVNHMHYAGHSFRIASATLMAVLNIPRPVQKNIGDWLGEAIDLYIRISLQQKLAASLQLGTLFADVAAV